jgi:hypothetical protein
VVALECASHPGPSSTGEYEVFLARCPTGNGREGEEGRTNSHILEATEVRVASLSLTRTLQGNVSGNT